MVFTFDPHPVRLLRPSEAPPPLTWTDRKAELLDALGVDAVIAYPTDEALLQLSAEAFFNQIVRQQLDARAMVEGPNFLLRAPSLGQRRAARPVDPRCRHPPGSRRAAGRGRRLRIQLADSPAGGCRRRGPSPPPAHAHRIGFAAWSCTEPAAARSLASARPTWTPSIRCCLASAFTPAGASSADRRLPAAINIGPNPTFGEGAAKVEVHLVGWDDSPLYGQVVEVDFLTRGCGTFNDFRASRSSAGNYEKDVDWPRGRHSKNSSWPISWRRTSSAGKRPGAVWRRSPGACTFDPLPHCPDNPSKRD